jgi:hypothetical protein
MRRHYQLRFPAARRRATDIAPKKKGRARARPFRLGRLFDDEGSADACLLVNPEGVLTRPDRHEGNRDASRSVFADFDAADRGRRTPQLDLDAATTIWFIQTFWKNAGAVNNASSPPSEVIVRR